MDGNGRWARRRLLPRVAGHKSGVDATRRVIEACARLGVETLTLFAFSSENWRRPEDEVSALMQLFISALGRELEQLAKNGVRIRFIGDRSAFPEPLRQLIAEAEARTRELTRLNLVIAANYGGQWDLTEAARSLAADVAAGKIAPTDVDTQALADRLSTAGLPDPDLFIRTGGERRISNFLLWQLAYTELYFTDVLWPDFDERELEAALEWFAQRQRRFGRTGDQVQAVENA